jgi:hypothetical protein
MKKASGSRANFTIATLVLAVLLIPVGTSCRAALAALGSMGPTERTVEWLRNKGHGRVRSRIPQPRDGAVPAIGLDLPRRQRNPEVAFVLNVPL